MHRGVISARPLPFLRAQAEKLDEGDHFAHGGVKRWSWRCILCRLLPVDNEKMRVTSRAYPSCLPSRAPLEAGLMVRSCRRGTMHESCWWVLIIRIKCAENEIEEWSGDVSFNNFTRPPATFGNDFNGRPQHEYERRMPPPENEAYYRAYPYWPGWWQMSTARWKSKARSHAD